MTFCTSGFHARRDSASTFEVVILPIIPSILSTLLLYLSWVSAETHHFKNSQAAFLFFDFSIIPQPVPAPETKLFPFSVPGTSATVHLPSISLAAEYSVIYIVYGAIPSGIEPTLKRL